MERGIEIVARGLSNLEELEQVKRQESEAALDVQLSSIANDVVDWNAVLGVLPDLGSLGDPGSFGGTPLISPGSRGS